jgi:hypothetical protein
MARKSSTKTTENPTEQIMNAIDTPVNLEWSETAEKLNISIPDLQERVAAKLSDSTVFAWDNLPVEHEPVIDAIARDLEAEASVRRLGAATEPLILQAQAQDEPPIMDEEPKPKKRGGRPKKDSTALTKKKTEEIQETRQDATEITDGIAETLIDFNAMEGLQDSSNAATAYLAAFTTNLVNKKGEGASIIAAEILTRTAKKQNFSSNEVLERMGVPLSKETRANLSNIMGQMQGETQEATEEMMDTAWGNGFNPQDALTRLRNLRKSSS